VELIASNPGIERGQLQTTAGEWPVLVRLPNVTVQPPPAGLPSSRSTKSKGVEYRFDPPQTRSRQPAGPHDDDRHAPRRGSPVLPSSNPFSIPGSTLQESLSPLVRFVMLFILVTAAGTIFLMSKSNRQPTAPPSTPSAARPQSLEHADVRLEPAAATPVANGPLHATSSETSVQDKPTSALAISAPPAGPTATRSDDTPVDATASAPQDAGETSDVPPVPAAGVNKPKLPQVQLAEPQAQAAQTPHATARLRGDIVEAPSHQASNDDHQSSIY
jgi:hypothetical protein